MLISSVTGMMMHSWMLEGKIAILSHPCLRAKPDRNSLPRIAEAPFTDLSFVMTHISRSGSSNGSSKSSPIISRTLPPKQTVDGFYAGESVPVNEALSKIFIQLHITEHTGRGIPQITSVYGRDNIRIKENNIVVTIPFDRLEDTTYTSEIQDDAQVKSENAQVNAQVNVKHVQVETQNNDVNLEEKVIQFCSEAKSIIEICDYLGFKDRRTVRKILNPLLELGRLAMTVPDKPNSRNQKYISIK